jgi:LPXTG-motif cell wall-anchored protein
VLDASVTTVTPSNAAAAEAPDTGTLPRTGGGGGSGLIVGLGLLIAGGALVLGTRRSIRRIL